MSDTSLAVRCGGQASRAARQAIPLTVIVPVYNEERTVGELLHRVLRAPYPDKQVIVVDDGSTDATPTVLRDWESSPGVLVLQHTHNLGKGTAVRTALPWARGEVTIIQDADLEYDPADYPRLVELIRHGHARVVYGSRSLSRGCAGTWTKFRLAVVGLNALVLVLYGRRLTDEATCYKALPTALLRRLRLEARHFELCAELTAKVCRLGWPIVEVPVTYHPRGVAAGKKIGWRDAWEAVWTLIKWRFLPFPAVDPRPPLAEVRPSGRIEGSFKLQRP